MRYQIGKQISFLGLFVLLTNLWTFNTVNKIVCYTAVFSVVTQCGLPTEWGAALRDDSKIGGVADYKD